MHPFVAILTEAIRFIFFLGKIIPQNRSKCVKRVPHVHIIHPWLSFVILRVASVFFLRNFGIFLRNLLHANLFLRPFHSFIVSRTKHSGFSFFSSSCVFGTVSRPITKCWRMGFYSRPDQAPPLCV